MIELTIILKANTRTHPRARSVDLLFALVDERGATRPEQHSLKAIAVRPGP